MKHAKWTRIVGVALVALVSVVLVFAADTPEMKVDRGKAEKLLKQGNYKEAWVLYSKLAKNPYHRSEAGIAARPRRRGSAHWRKP